MSQMQGFRPIMGASSGIYGPVIAVAVASGRWFAARERR
jgi:hypothetical protein